MTTDLFQTKTKSKREQLREWLKQRHYIKTSDVVRWGLDNKHIRADRDCRDFAREGLIRRMGKSEKALRYGNIKDGIWIYVDTGQKI